jgi:hypothetical protein
MTFSLVIRSAGWLIVQLFGGWLFSVKYWLYTKVMKLEDGFYSAQSQYKHFYTISELKQKAIDKNSSVLYSEVLKREAEVADRRFISYMCQSLITLLAVGWIFDNPDYPSIISNFGILTTSLPWYSNLLLSLVVYSFLLFVFHLAYEKQEFERFIAIEKNEC